MNGTFAVMVIANREPARSLGSSTWRQDRSDIFFLLIIPGGGGVLSYIYRCIIAEATRSVCAKTFHSPPLLKTKRISYTESSDLQYMWI